MTGQNHVLILLATLNGAEFLQQQLNSIECQTHKNWSVWASDDGSSDATIDLLEMFRNKWGKEKFQLFTGPQLGFAANFMSLVAKASGQSTYYAYCDQDDVWHPKKLEIAINHLQSEFTGRPSLYCSRTELIDKSGNKIGLSPHFVRPPSFENSLIQSIAGGNTMVFNQEACALLSKFEKISYEIVSHDWSTYQIVAGSGGRIFYDSWASVSYRQHDKNAIGSNIGFYARLVRFRLLLGGRFKDWNNRNLSSLENFSSELEISALRSLQEFSSLRKMPKILLIRALYRHSFYRHTRMGNLAFNVGLLLGRV